MLTGRPDGLQGIAFRASQGFVALFFGRAGGGGKVGFNISW